MNDRYELAVIGAGLSGLSALSALAPRLTGKRVIVLEHRDVAGGALLPLSDEPEFAEVREFLQGFQMPTEITACFGATAVGLMPAMQENEPHTVIVRQRRGTIQVQAKTAIIASGGLELTREHAGIPGTRPAGVVTPVLVHQFLARGYLPGRRAVVYGDSRYARITARRLSEAGVQVISFTPPSATAGASEGQPELVEIQGFPRLQSLRLCDGAREFEQAADTLVYAGGMMANTHWLKGSGIDIEPAGAILVDNRYRTNIEGIYAVGTVIAPSLDHTNSIAMGKEVASLIGGQL